MPMPRTMKESRAVIIAMGAALLTLAGTLASAAWAEHCRLRDQVDALKMLLLEQRAALNDAGMLADPDAETSTAIAVVSSPPFGE